MWSEIRIWNCLNSGEKKICWGCERRTPGSRETEGHPCDNLDILPGIRGSDHERYLTETSNQQLPEAAQEAWDGALRGSWPCRRSRSDPITRETARRR